MAGNLTKFRLALIQFAVQANKQENLNRAVKLINEAAENGANVIALPECFNCPYGYQYFEEYAESIPGDSSDALSKAAKDNKIYLIGGSIPEKSGSKYYNTCPVFDRTGTLLVKHRKVHLFDIDIPGKITFQESKILSSGNHLTTFNTDYCRIGIGICYDLRFAEMAQLYRQNDCKLLVYPGAFNMTTGPLHWELLQKVRAVDNQIFVAGVSPARDTSASYVAWGHSTVIDPWGKVIAKCEEGEKIVYADIDLNVLKEVREQIPLTIQRRADLYHVKSSEDVMVCY